MSRIRIFTGHFGSGKSEIAINYALDLAEKGKKVSLVDIDIVNPYFCIRDLKGPLESKGVRVISADPSFSNAELMVVPPEVSSVFNDKSAEVVMDIGGDNTGATVLGQYNSYLQKEDYDLYFVINNNRPLTLDSEGVEEQIKAIESSSRLKITYLISNTNLSYETTTEHILKGDKDTYELSKRLNIPYKYVVCRRDMVDSIKDKVHAPILPIDIYMKPPWR
ncbi:CobQ/CobB/MinD/ParA nucleotide binding domain-containing protein [Clostridium putrefaciens]|uniref:CobQ/CobB/MinD/ParA nucleotide binding domain-containing protein n=1 Tax=Clostridium putrefaciens TaxID=99675 RepID=A0A381JB16_9CLOT|nr:P-loop NTPase [Clostridium putrefaciens]SUY48193.1 CobQ/CobB/MinD/ParA nucleotide binding domain-containing protein [Clostridium putrefaciens]